MTTIPGFLTKTYEIFNTPEYTDCCGWGNNGSTIVIKKVIFWEMSFGTWFLSHTSYITTTLWVRIRYILHPLLGLFRLNSFRRASYRNISSIRIFSHLSDSWTWYVFVWIHLNLYQPSTWSIQYFTLHGILLTCFSLDWTVQYDFRKTVQDPNHGEFQHPNFRQDRPELLPNIKRKAHHKSSESSKKSLGVLLSEASEYSG